MPEGKSEPITLELAVAQIDGLAAQIRGLERHVSLIDTKLDHLTVLADQAAEFLHDPIGRYKRRLGKINARTPGGTPA